MATCVSTWQSSDGNRDALQHPPRFNVSIVPSRTGRHGRVAAKAPRRSPNRRTTTCTDASPSESPAVIRLSGLSHCSVLPTACRPHLRPLSVVAPGVYALLGSGGEITPENGGRTANVAFIVGPRGVIVVEPEFPTVTVKRSSLRSRRVSIAPSGLRYCRIPVRKPFSALRRSRRAASRSWRIAKARS